MDPWCSWVSEKNGTKGIDGRVEGRALIFSWELFMARWWDRRTCAHLLLWELQNYNLLLNNHWQEKVGSHQKKILNIQGQGRSPSKMVGRVKPHLESNPISAQRTQTKLCVHQDPENPPRLSQTCAWVSCGGTTQLCPNVGAGDLGTGVWSHSLWHKPYWRRPPLTPP